jgi:hypothetical protein
MSVFNMSAAATDKIFLDFVLPGMTVQIRENTTLVDRFQTDTEHVVGRKALFKCLTGSPKSARPSSSSTLPTAKQGTYSEFELYMKRSMYAQLQFDGLANACSKGPGAVMEIVKAEVKGILMQIGNKFNRQFWGDGSGRLAQLSAGVSDSVTVIVDGPYFGQDANKRTNPANYLDAGMDVDIYSTAGALEAEEVEISSIVDNGDGTATLTMAEKVTCSNNAYIFDHDTYGSGHAAGIGVPQGLLGIIDDANPYIGITQVYFQGVDRVANPWARAQVVNMGGVAWTEDAALELVMNCEKWSRIKVLITNAIIHRAVYKILSADALVSREPAMWGGMEGIAFYGGRKGKIPIIYDTDCPDNRMFAIDDDLLQVYAPTAGGLDWIPGDSGILTRVHGKDEWVASLVKYDNFGTTKPQGLGVLENIKHASS